ncbi:hypothetical protein MNBD_GAMMA14-1263 [hydrothermal vent metagenome]|uniref:Uncharacterized protein n=1 Tax=hydrothermal vent metagenome TaxID=652676 RepID=A0A3B0YZW8_9ZZZZ
MSPSPGPKDKSAQSTDSHTSFKALHCEVDEWRNEHNAWLKDIEQWRREQRLVKLILYKMERTLPDQNNSLDEHINSIRKHKQRVNLHGRNFHNLLASDKSCPADNDILLKEHNLQKSQHLQEKERHELFRDTHQAAMSELTRLTRLLEQTERP